MNTDPTGMCLGAYCALACLKHYTPGKVSTNNAARPNNYKPDGYVKEYNKERVSGIDRITYIPPKETKEVLNSLKSAPDAGPGIAMLTGNLALSYMEKNGNSNVT